MSISGNKSLSTPFFHEIKKQASFFLKAKIRSARLALTDVTPAELLTEEATNGNPWGPDTKTMGLISRAAFEVDDYWRIVEILHRRLLRFDKKNWRESYKALILLEHLLTHGPESVASEFQPDREVITEMGSFQYIDERGFNWGLTLRKKSDRILQLLEKGQLLKDERARARKLTHGIQGFGSFCQRSSSSASGSFTELNSSSYGRSNSHCAYYTRQENDFLSFQGDASNEGTQIEENCEARSTVVDKKVENLNRGNLDILPVYKKETLRQPLKEKIAERSIQNIKKENIVPIKKLPREELHELDCSKELKPLLGDQQVEPKKEFPAEDHPFNDPEHLSVASLLSVS